MQWFRISLLLSIFAIGESVAADSYYQMGKDAATGLAQSAWADFGKDCTQVPTLSLIIEAGISDAATDMRTKYSGKSGKNFGKGYQAGLSNALKKVRHDCRSHQNVSKRLDKLSRFAENKFGHTPRNSNKTGSSFYTTGQNSAQQLADSAWKSLGKRCTRIGDFSQLIEDSMDDITGDIGTTYKGKSATDFAKGYLAGLSNSLKKVQRHCPNYKTAYKIASCRVTQLEKQVTQSERRLLENLSDTSRSFYSMGKDLAKSEVKTAWENTQSTCTKSKSFSTLIQASIKDVVRDLRNKYTGASLQAFGSGYIAGLSSELRKMRCKCRENNRTQRRFDWLRAHAMKKINAIF